MKAEVNYFSPRFHTGAGWIMPVTYSANSVFVQKPNYPKMFRLDQKQFNSGMVIKRGLWTIQRATAPAEG